MKIRRNLPVFLTVFLLFVILSVAQLDVAHASSSDDLQNNLLGNIADSSNNQHVGYMEEMLAGLVTAIPSWMMDVLKLEDINKLVFLNNDWIYHTFPTGVWEAANTFYTLATSIAAYLMVLGFIAWGIIFLTRSVSSQTQGTMKDMARGFAIYIIGIWLGNYLFELIFTINEYIVKFALYGLQSRGISTHVSLLNMFKVLQNGSTLGGALMFFLVVFSIGVLNYQYALRMLMLVILIILFPICAYTSIFPSSRKALDMWFREFASQVLMNGGHALGYALFLILAMNKASNWILFAFLFGLPQITGAIRMILGAPGGIVSGSMGMGSVAAITQIIRSSKGGMGGGGIPLASSGGSTASNVASSALGIVAPKGNSLVSGMSKAMGRLSTVTPPMVKTLGKAAGMATAITGGAMVGGALMGERGAAVGAAGGLALGNKAMSRKNSGAQVMNSTYDGENHRMNVRLPLSPNTSHERAWESAQNKTPEGYDLQSVNLTPKGWMANMQKSGAGDGGQPASTPNTSATPSPTRNTPSSSNTSNSSSRGPTTPSSRRGSNASSVPTSSGQSVGGQQVRPQPVTTGPRRPGGFNPPPPPPKNGTVNLPNTSQAQTQTNTTPSSTNQQVSIPSPTMITRPPNPPTSSK